MKHLSAILSLALLLFASERADAEPGNYAPPSSEPQDLFTFNSFVYFSADDGIHGRELWRCDVAGNAELVADITPGSAGSAISRFSALPDVLLFRVDPQESGSELWRTDGTTVGTVRLKVFNKDQQESFDALCGITADGRGLLRVVNQVAAFYICDGTAGGTQELPTNMADGTRVIPNFHASIQGEGFYFGGVHLPNGPGLFRYDFLSSTVERIAALESPGTEFFDMGDGRLLFPNSAPGHGLELFITAGTEESTRMVRDIAPGEPPSTPTDLALVPGEGGPTLVVFQADDGVHGSEPWLTDGTEAGTRLLTDLLPGPDGSRPYRFFAKDTRITFAAIGPGIGKEVWLSHRPFETVELLGDIMPGALGSDPYALCPTPNGDVVLSALGPDTGEEPYRVDPSRRQLERLADIYPGPDSSYPFYNVVLGDGVVFAATDPVHGRELWYTDLSTGTRLLADIYSDASVNPSSSPAQLTPQGDHLFFVANDIAHGAELWVSGGSGETTRMVKDIFPGQPSSAPHSLTPTASLLYFAAEDGINGYRLWQSDGSEVGTILVDAVSEAPQHLTVLGDVVLYSAHRAEEGRELWSAGTGEPVLVKDIATGSRSSNPRNFAIFQGNVYFLADDRVHGEELWRSDGTADGTVMVRDLAPVPYEPLRFGSLVAGEKALYLAGGSASLGAELWRFDPARKRPLVVKDIGAWEVVDALRPPAPRLRGD